MRRSAACSTVGCAVLQIVPWRSCSARSAERPPRPRRPALSFHFRRRFAGIRVAPCRRHGKEGHAMTAVLAPLSWALFGLVMSFFLTREPRLTEDGSQIEVGPRSEEH